MDATFSQRRSLFETSEQVWSVDASGLHLTEAGGAKNDWAWRDLRALRLTVAPTRLKPWRREAEFDFGSAGRLKLDNGHYVGIGDFENRDASFAGLVEAAVSRVVAANSAARFALGARGGAYWTQMLFATAAVGLLAAVIVMLPIPGWPWTAIAKLVVLIALIPPTLRWAIRGRPRRATAQELLDYLSRP